jgi:hypothetical protein
MAQQTRQRCRNGLFRPVLTPFAIPGPETKKQKAQDEDEAGVAQDLGRKHGLRTFGTGF